MSDSPQALEPPTAPRRGIRRAVGGRPENLVEVGPYRSDRALPLVVRPALDGVNLTAWAVSNRDTVETWLHTYGGVLFRGFGMHSAEKFQAFMSALYTDLVGEHERSSPRSQVSGDVYTSTDHPADQTIFVHNEMSYSHRWPTRIAFCCGTAADTGGETPIADLREVSELIGQDLRDRLVERKVQYIRNYGGGFGLPWQTSFQTENRAEVEKYCQEAGATVEWKEGGGLRTTRVAGPVARHPVTGELVWFNHATFFHVSTLAPMLRDTLLAELGYEDLPTNTCYGDGSPIEPAVLDALRSAYQQATVAFPWQEGDVLLLDNMLAAHGRSPYSGARQVFVSMAQPITERETQV